MHKQLNKTTDQHQMMEQQAAESSDGYVVADLANSSASDPSYEEYLGGSSGGGCHEDEAHCYRQFDPYSIYSEEEDVWYSEERIFEVSTFSSLFLVLF